MADQSDFVILNRSDGSKVAVQLSTVLFFTKAPHGCVLNFGGSTQVNVKEDFEELLEKVGAEMPSA
ncbi:hypothetical protein [Sphingomicrobium marinum]|uniref:hypothetical protein n=1 Tax=Sphingomicrobium marinum TaxID=1227950 RepID=UPI00223FE866|nr:hypothetical protein [Sphingomicrobium marinum]